MDSGSDRKAQTAIWEGAILNRNKTEVEYQPSLVQGKSHLFVVLSGVPARERQHEVKKLISAPGSIFICDECVK
jgi:hypothetical protein